MSPHLSCLYYTNTVSEVKKHHKHNVKNAITVAYLWKGRAELALQRITVVDDVLKMLLGQAEALLGLPQSVQQPVPFVQHVNHQLLKVGVWVRGAALRATLAQSRVLADSGHHFAHHLGTAGKEGD